MVDSLKKNNSELNLMYQEAKQNDERSTKLSEKLRLKYAELQISKESVEHELSLEKAKVLELHNRFKSETALLVSSSTNRVNEIAEEHEQNKRRIKEEHSEEITNLCASYDNKLSIARRELDNVRSDLSDVKLRLEDSHKRGLEVVSDQEAQIRSLELDNKSLNRRLVDSEKVCNDLYVRLNDSVSRVHFTSVQDRFHNAQKNVDELTATLREIQIDKNRDCRNKW